jgi:diguanylate cyclase (GGDEF)-like protein
LFTFRRIAQRWPSAHRVLTNVVVIAVPTTTTAAAIVHDRTYLAVLTMQITVVVYAIVYAKAHAWHHSQLNLVRAELDRARRDPLTGLPTRAVADDFIESAQRSASDLTVALADIDGLHAINSNLGHAAGDLYITAVAARLARAVPPGGCLVRQGGDEFTIVALDTEPDDLATAIGAAMAGPALIGGYRIQPRASVGVATGDPRDATNTRACADAAMYTAKAAGGNHTRVYQPDRDGRPQPDGTRPIIRRRDLNPTGDNTAPWLPAPGDDLLPFLFSLDEALSVQHALHTAESQRPQTTTDHVDVEPDPGGDRGIGGHPKQEHLRYVGIADRMTPIINAAQRPGAEQPPRPSNGLAGETPVGAHRRRVLDWAGLHPAEPIEVIVVRDPDAANTITVFLGGRDASTIADLTVVDIDPGASDVSPEWVTANLDRAAHLSPAAFAEASTAIGHYAADNDVDMPTLQNQPCCTRPGEAQPESSA